MFTLVSRCAVNYRAYNGERNLGKYTRRTDGMIESEKLNKIKDATMAKDVYLPLDIRPPKELR